MAMNKDTKAWAIKLRGRSFYQNNDGVPYLFPTKRNALSASVRVGILEGTTAKPIRVRVRIEEIE
jgi:hypothetical protein